MNTEAWDDFIKLEEQADTILVGPSTAGRVGKYISTRQRLKAPAVEAPTEVPRLQTVPLAVKGSARPLERIRLTLFNQQGKEVKLVELEGTKRDLVIAVAKATGVSVIAAGLGRSVEATKLSPKADKRKQTKRKAYK